MRTEHKGRKTAAGTMQCAISVCNGGTMPRSIPRADSPRLLKRSRRAEPSSSNGHMGWLRQRRHGKGEELLEESARQRPLAPRATSTPRTTGGAPDKLTEVGAPTNLSTVFAPVVQVPEIPTHVIDRQKLGRCEARAPITQ